MRSEEEFIEEIETEKEGSEATEAEMEEEYEEIPLESFSEYDIEIMIKKAEIWDKLARAEITPREAEKLIKSLAIPTEVPVQAPSKTRRKRRRSSKSKSK
ncbi:MAG: hypothetical protein DRO15_07565 [Thermoprotei archaeon]|nr:MAG: hypothetical protein DRO15_07565 [Thermoprotei archaeon]